MNLVIQNLLSFGLLVDMIYQSYFLIFVAPYLVDGLALLLVPVVTIPIYFTLIMLKLILYRFNKLMIPKDVKLLVLLALVQFIFAISFMFLNPVFLIIGILLSLYTIGVNF